MRRLSNRTAGLFAALLLTGCALQPAPQDVPLAERTRAGAFELEGRIAANDGERAANGTLLWSHAPGRDEWTVLSPLGQIVAEVVATLDGAVLRAADGQRVDAADAAELLPRVLGVPAPADHLAHWVQAIPAPGARVVSVDAAGRPLRITDSGWIIDYPAYADDSPDAAPRRIDARWGEARLRIVVDAWTRLD